MTRPLRIALGDLSYFTEGNAHNLYVPLNLGYIASYAKAKFGSEIDIKLFKDPTRMLKHVRDEKPDLLGLSAYYWQDNLNKVFVNKVRSLDGYRPPIIMGGPSVDSDLKEQKLFLDKRPGVDSVVVNEGEEGFASIIGALLGNATEQALEIRPERVGLKTDLDSLPSPYLDGTLDEFLVGSFQPMMQTSRLCPYTCSFCVSGKNVGKLRAFSEAQVEAELDYISKKFQDRKDVLLYLTDENFGILKRDVDLARMIRGFKDRTGYPQRIFYYNDKRFTQNSRDVQEVLGDMCWHGVMLSLQSENPETLKAIKRRNLTDADIKSAISWAHGLNLPVSTELIFGLPYETRQSFLALLDKCARLGFDRIQCYNLIVFDGIEMNRRVYREEHVLKTKKRPINAHSLVLDGEECSEFEEVVVSSNSISFDDYQIIRSMNVMFHAVFVNGMKRQFFKDLVTSGGSLTTFFTKFLTPTDWDEPEADAHRQFLTDLNHQILAEIDGSQINQVVKIQPVFAGRLVENENGWVGTIIDKMANDVTDAVVAA